MLRELKSSHPNLRAALKRSYIGRRARMGALKDGARLRGMEEFLDYLAKEEALFRSKTKLAPLAFLVARLREDFEDGIDASLSGSYAVVSNSMRDAMEIEFLFREFAHDPQRVGEWASLTDNERWWKFGPAKLRKLHARRLNTTAAELPESTDYAAHSSILHVNPPHPVFPRKAGPGGVGGFWDDVGFQELFEHGRRVAIQLHAFKRAVLPKGTHGRSPLKTLPRFKDGWERTQQIQQLYLALFEAASETRKRRRPAAPKARPEKSRAGSKLRTKRADRSKRQR